MPVTPMMALAPMEEVTNLNSQPIVRSPVGTGGFLPERPRWTNMPDHGMLWRHGEQTILQRCNPPRAAGLWVGLPRRSYQEPLAGPPGPGGQRQDLRLPQPRGRSLE